MSVSVGYARMTMVSVVSNTGYVVQQVFPSAVDSPVAKLVTKNPYF
jgi:hypothetical protein